MTQVELKMLLKDVEIAQQQLEAIRQRIRAALHFPEQTVADTPAAGTVPSPKFDRDNEPDIRLLAELPCPICGSAMRWKYSQTNGQWFAGCVEFKPKGSGCRGSRSFTKVMAAQTTLTADKSSAERCAARDSGNARCTLPEGHKGDHTNTTTVVEPPPVEGPTTSSRDPGPLPEVLPYTLDDYERIEKHHGPEAADDLDANGDPVKIF